MQSWGWRNIQTDSQSHAVPLILEQDLFKCNPFKSIKLKYFLLSIQKIVKFNWVQYHSRLKEVSYRLPSKGQLPLAIKLDFQHTQEMLRTRTLIWALTNLQLLKHIGMIAGSFIYNLIGTSSVALVASKKKEESHVLKPHITEYCLSVNRFKHWYSVCARLISRTVHCCKGNAVHNLLCWGIVYIRDGAFQEVYKNLW